VGLVKIVDVKNQIALGRGKSAKVHQVAVTADLLHQPGVRCACQVVGLNDRAAPVKGKRRSQHAPVAQRHKALHPTCAGGFQQFDWVAIDVANGMV